MKLQRPIRKRSFLLFELLLAIALISLCLFPLLKPHAQIRKFENDSLEKMYFETEAKTAFCTLKQKLFEHEIPFHSLMKKKPDGELKGTFSYKGKTYTCTYQLLYVFDRHKINNDKMVAMKADIYFHYNKRSIGPYTFVFNVEYKNQ